MILPNRQMSSSKSKFIKFINIMNRLQSLNVQLPSLQIEIIDTNITDRHFSINI